MQYMISPLDLSQRQLLIYKVLYDKCDFNTMQVSITVRQIALSITEANYTDKMIRKSLDEMIQKGYIEVISTGRRGRPSFYRIIKMKKVGKLEGSYREARSKLKCSNINTSKDRREAIGELEVNSRSTLSKDKDKDIDIYIYSRVIDYLNEKTSKNFKHTTKKTKSCIDARLGEGFTEADFLKVIDTKTKQWKDNSDMNKFLRPETLFGTKFEGYLQESNYNDKEKQKNKEVNFDDIKILDNENNRIDI